MAGWGGASDRAVTRRCPVARHETMPGVIVKYVAFWRCWAAVGQSRIAHSFQDIVPKMVFSKIL